MSLIQPKIICQHFEATRKQQSIKRLLLFASLLLLLLSIPSYALSSTAMHISNSNSLLECIYCHPEGEGSDLPKTSCIDCHKNSSGENYTEFDTIEVATHSSVVIGSDSYGTWTEECVDCHDPHINNGLNLLDGIANSSYVLVDLTVDQAVTNTGNLTTTFNTMQINNIYDPAWADPATWGEKTSPERGLIFVWQNPTLNKYYWYEVNNATATTITINAPDFPRIPELAPAPVNAQLIYGMHIENEIGPLPVVYSGPKSMSNDESGTGTDPTPDGICQVCHTQTLYWRNDGSLANHYSGQNCITCHPHEAGFKPVELP